MPSIVTIIWRGARLSAWRIVLRRLHGGVSAHALRWTFFLRSSTGPTRASYADTRQRSPNIVAILSHPTTERFFVGNSSVLLL